MRAVYARGRTGTAMRRILPAIAALALAASFVSAQEPAENQSDAAFREPELSEAGELAITKFAGGIGIVVLEPVIGEDGTVESVETIRSTPGLETWAVSAVKAWKFRPALMDGKPAESKTTVVVVFNQGFNVPPSFSLPPRAEQPDDDHPRETQKNAKLADFVPPLPTDVRHTRIPRHERAHHHRGPARETGIFRRHRVREAPSRGSGVFAESG